MCRLFQFFWASASEKLGMTFGSAGFPASDSEDAFSFAGPTLNMPWKA